MAAKANPSGWDRVLVRHVVPAKRDSVTRLEPLLRVPFPGGRNTTSTDQVDDLSFLGPPSGRWMLATRFDGPSWVSLFSAAADGKSLFDANSDSRRMEVAWVGCRPEGEGWFVRIRRAGKPVVDFRQPIGTCSAGPGQPRADDDGEEAFHRVCAQSDLTLPSREILAGEREFVLVGARGKPVKSGLHGYVFFQCPALTAGEDPASDDLARAIDQGDADGIRDALRRGASLTIQPDVSSSPLVSALYHCGRFEPRRWQECLEILLAAGCPINGTTKDTPPLVDCIRPYLSDGDARKMVQFLLAHGADANATGPRGELALFEAVVQGRVALVQLLMRHGADPTRTTPMGISIIEWLRQRVEAPSSSLEPGRYAEILKLLE